MAAVFWGFRVMFLAALLMFGTVFYATILRLRRKLWTSRRFHRFLLWTTPVGILAILGGWATAETGRQPWVVFGQLRTADAVSHLAPGEARVLGRGLLACCTWRCWPRTSPTSCTRCGSAPNAITPTRDRPALDAAPMPGLAGGRSD